MIKGNIVVQVHGNGKIGLSLPQGCDLITAQAYLLQAAFQINGAVQKKAPVSNIFGPNGVRVGMN